MTNGIAQIQVTKEGLDHLKNEYNHLVEEKRPQVVERLAHARSMGDLSENQDYISAKEELEFVDGRIAELEAVLNNAVVVKTNGTKQVGIGTQVTVDIDGSEQLFHIVGEWEADPKSRKISHESPLGQALVGKKVGDMVEVEAPVGKITYKILDIA